MGIYRLYTGNDGETHVEEIDLGKHPELLPVQKVAGIRLSPRQSGPASPFEPEPIRRWMCILSGKFEVGLGRWQQASVRPGRHTPHRGHHRPRPHQSVPGADDFGGDRYRSATWLGRVAQTAPFKPPALVYLDVARGLWQEKIRFAAIAKGELDMGVYRMYTGDDGECHIEEDRSQRAP